MSRQLSTLSSTNKRTLRNWFNETVGSSARSIDSIRSYMKLDTNQEAYEALQYLYNAEIRDLQRAKKQAKLQTRQILKSLPSGAADIPAAKKIRSQPSMKLEKLGSYVQYWLKKNPTSFFEITLKSRVANIKRTFKFNHPTHFENWLGKLISDQEIDSAGTTIDKSQYDLFKDVIVENIKQISGGRSTREKTVGLKSSFYNYKLFCPSSRGNNCFFACLRHMTGSEESYHNLRKKFELSSGSEISISDAYRIISELGLDIQIIAHDTNEELDDSVKYIVYQDSHYYVLESFEQVVLKDKKTKRGLLTFDFETRNTSEYDVIKATGEKLYILQDSLCCVYFRKYKKTECESIRFVSGEKSSARQLIDWFNNESKNGRTYNVVAHNGGRFDYYFFISNLTSAELLECDIHFRGTTIISINYRGHLFKDSACFLTDSLKNLSKSFKVGDGKITEFNLHGTVLTNEQLCFYKPHLGFDEFMSLQNTDREFWELYEKYCLYDCIALFQIWEKFTECVNSLIEKISPYLLSKCPLMASTTIGSHSKKIIVEVNKYNGKTNTHKRGLELFTGIEYKKVGEKFEKTIDFEKYQFLCNFKRGGISHCNQMGKHMTGITGVDIASQYPASLIYSKIPTGQSEWTTEYDPSKHGFYLLKDCVFNSYKLKPVAASFRQESLNWATNDMSELYVDSYMLHYIIENYGLKSFTVVRGLVSEKEIDGVKIFGAYINTFYTEKKLQDTLKSEKSPLYNEALRSTIKLYLNSLTGKLVENPALHFSVKFDPTSCKTLNGQGISKQFNDDKINDWLVAGLMVYSYSKRLLFEYIKCLPNNSDSVIHIETDGIYFSTNDLEVFTENLNNYTGDYPCKFGEDLGNLKIEKTTYAGQVAYFLGKKFYCITMNNDYNNKPRDEKDKNIYRIKGIPQKTITVDGSDKWLVDVQLYNDIFEGKEISRSFSTLKKTLFSERTRITSYQMTRTIKGNGAKFQVYE